MTRGSETFVKHFSIYVHNLTFSALTLVLLVSADIFKKKQRHANPEARDYRDRARTDSVSTTSTRPRKRPFFDGKTEQGACAADKAFEVVAKGARGLTTAGVGLLTRLAETVHGVV